MEQQKTLTLIERIPEDKLNWKPHEKSFSPGQLAMHIAQTPGDVSQMLQYDQMDRANMDFDNHSPHQSKKCARPQ